MCVDLLVGTQVLGAVEAVPAEPEEEGEIQDVWALSVCDTSGLPLDTVTLRQLRSPV